MRGAVWRGTARPNDVVRQSFWSQATFLGCYATPVSAMDSLRPDELPNFVFPVRAELYSIVVDVNDDLILYFRVFVPWRHIPWHYRPRIEHPPTLLVATRFEWAGWHESLRFGG